jgi:hypothetical protein
MNQVMLNQFLLGMLVMACLAAGLFLLRFFRKTHDRLFLIFALAIWLLGTNWLALAFVNRDETRTWLYVIRLIAFILILLGIADKNRTPQAGR